MLFFFLLIFSSSDLFGFSCIQLASCFVWCMVTILRKKHSWTRREQACTVLVWARHKSKARCVVGGREFWRHHQFLWRHSPEMACQETWDHPGDVIRFTENLAVPVVTSGSEMWKLIGLILIKRSKKHVLCSGRSRKLQTFVLLLQNYHLILILTCSLRVLLCCAHFAVLRVNCVTPFTSRRERWWLLVVFFQTGGEQTFARENTFQGCSLLQGCASAVWELKFLPASKLSFLSFFLSFFLSLSLSLSLSPPPSLPSSHRGSLSLSSAHNAHLLTISRICRQCLNHSTHFLWGFVQLPGENLMHWCTPLRSPCVDKHRHAATTTLPIADNSNNMSTALLSLLTWKTKFPALNWRCSDENGEWWRFRTAQGPILCIEFLPTVVLVSSR